MKVRSDGPTRTSRSRSTLLALALTLSAPVASAAGSLQGDDEVDELLASLLAPRVSFNLHFGFAETDGWFGSFSLGSRKYTLRPESFAGDLEALREGVRRTPASPEAHYRLAEALRKRRSLRQVAGAVWGQRARREAGEVSLWASEAFHHLQVSEELFRAAEAAGALTEDARLLYADGLESLGRKDEAFQLLEEMAARPEPSWRALEKLSEWERANPFSALLQESEGKVSTLEEEQAQRRRSLDLLQRAIEIRPQEARLYLERVAFRSMTGISDVMLGRPLDLDLLDLIEADLEYARGLPGSNLENRAVLQCWQSALVLLKAGTRRQEKNPDAKLLDDESFRTAVLADGWLEALWPVVDSLRSELGAEEIEAIEDGLVDLREEGAAGDSRWMGFAEVLSGIVVGDRGRVLQGLGSVPFSAELSEAFRVAASIAESVEADREDWYLDPALREFLPVELHCELRYLEGDLRSGDGEFEPAAAAYRRALALDLDHQGAWLGLGISLIHTEGGEVEAEKALSRASEYLCDYIPARGQAQLGLGLLAWKAGDLERAGTWFEEARVMAKGSPLAWRSYGEFLVRTDPGRPADARRTLEAGRAFLRASDLYRIDHMREEKKRYRVPEGQDRARLSKLCLDRARRAFAEAIALDASSEAEALRGRIDALEIELRLGVHYHERSAPAIHEEAISSLRELGGIEPPRAEDHALLARHLANLGDLAAAAESATRAIEASHRRDPEHLELLGMIRARQNEPALALEALEEAVLVAREAWGTELLNKDLDRIESRLSSVLVPLVQDQSDGERRLDGLRRLHDLILARADRPGARAEDLQNAANFLWSEASSPFDDPERAFQYALASVRGIASLSSAPRAAEARALLALGRGLLGRQREADAIEVLERCLDLEPANVEALEIYGDLLSRTGRDEEARSVFLRALEVDPSNAELQRELGRSLWRLELLEEAADAFGEVLRLQPDDARAHESLGRVEWERGRRESALGHLRRSLELDPASPAASDFLARCLAESGEVETALDVLERALERNPRQGSLMNSLAWQLATAGDPELRDPRRAVELGRQAVELCPEASHCCGTLGVALYRSGELEESLRLLEKALQMSGGRNPEQGYFLTMVCAALGRGEQARTWFEQASSWHAQDRPTSDELRRIQEEASAALLGDPAPQAGDPGSR